jgi:cytochrome c peroxidase
MTVAKVELGRHLFFDLRLSGNQQFSCSTCHQRLFGFGDARALPLGSTGTRLVRNSQPLANVAWLGPLTWSDPTATTLEQQMTTPLFGTAPVEMGVDDGNRAAVLARFSGNADYRTRFAASFPGEAEPVSWPNLIRAIAAFQRSLVSTDSRYDRALRGELVLTDAEQRGRDLFFSDRAGCSACHGGNTFAEPTSAAGVPVDTRYFNIGLYNVGNSGAYPSANRGLIDRTGVAADMGRFRTPSLRNVEVSAPYMNDGSVTTLTAVLDMKIRGGRDVTTGVNAGDGALNPWKSPLAGPRSITTPERDDLLAFLRALTDQTFLNNPAYANPFATP